MGDSDLELLELSGNCGNLCKVASKHNAESLSEVGEEGGVGRGGG